MVNIFRFVSLAVCEARLPEKIRSYRLCMWRYSATTRIEPMDFARSGCYKDATGVLQSATGKGWRLRLKAKTGNRRSGAATKRTLTAENAKNVERAWLA